MIRICLCSEDKDLQLLLTSSLPRDLQVLPGFSHEHLLNFLDNRACDVVFLDLTSRRYLARDRSDVFKRVMESQVGSVVLADEAERKIMPEFLRLGADEYCTGRWAVQEIDSAIRNAYQSSLHRSDPADSTDEEDGEAECGRLVGSSPSMRAIYKKIHSVADLNVPVLITGESGTGKELIARAIHTMGSRSDQPFVAVSAGAIPETLLESELFGHEKGAFTGAAGSRRGYFEEAGSGTLFLDEIGDISPRTQVMLLRALQEREFCRLGSGRPIPLKARIVFATNRNIEEMVNRGEFRSDLYYRINVIRISSSALRERPEDVPVIARHLIRQNAPLLGKKVYDIEPNAIRALQANPWPGNVRELENIIQRAMIASSGTTIQLSDLGEYGRPPSVVPRVAKPGKVDKSSTSGPDHPDGGPYGGSRIIVQELAGGRESDNVVCINEGGESASFMQMLRDYRLMLAESAIREHNGNKTLAARSLQISRAYLHRLLRNPGADDLDEECTQIAL
jgi:DNA-binding NtrC family response regulator